MLSVNWHDRAKWPKCNVQSNCHPALIILCGGHFASQRVICCHPLDFRCVCLSIHCSSQLVSLAAQSDNGLFLWNQEHILVCWEGRNWCAYKCALMCTSLHAGFFAWSFKTTADSKQGDFRYSDDLLCSQCRLRMFHWQLCDKHLTNSALMPDCKMSIS